MIVIKLKKLLSERGLSKIQLSNMASLNLNQINKYCNNDVKRLDIDVLARLCYVLKCELGELVEYEKDEEICCHK